MLRRARESVAPLYLFLCLLLGGSGKAIWGNLALELSGLAILTWAAVAKSREPLPPAARQLFLIALAALAAVAISTVPLPASVWSHLGPRGAIAGDYRLLELAAPALPLTLTPYETLDAALKLIPPLAVLAAMLRLKAYRPVWMVAAVLAASFGGIMLGALQLSAADPTSSPWYLYRETNWGAAVGFFANANHMATLLLISIPYAAAIVPAARGKNIQRFSAIVAVAVGILLVLLIGIALNGSLAAYGLVLPVAAASALIVVSQRSRLRPVIAVLAVILMAAGIVALSSSAVGGDRFTAEANSSVTSRAEMLATTMQAAKDFLPFGSGLGSFREVYHLYENPAEVTNTYVAHAHNEYAELALELGVAGILLMVAFLTWWAVAVWRVWRSAEAGSFVRAASIASAAVLAHSLVDFPLRTAAISASFAFCLALLADRRSPQKTEAADLRPTRHIVFR